MLTRINPDQFDLTHIDILGRGQSVDSYEPTRKGAFIICTHYPILYPTVICNAIATREYGEYGFYPVPYITYRKITHKPLKAPITVIDWTVMVDDKAPIRRLGGLNTGVIAYLWACAQKPKTIHMWGFDNILGKEYTEHSEREKRVLIENYNYVESMNDLAQSNIFNAWSSIIKSNTTVHLPEK